MMKRCIECGSEAMTASDKVCLPRARAWPMPVVDGMRCADCGKAFPVDGARERAQRMREAVTIPAPAR